MSFRLIFDYPWYFIVFCLLAGAFIAFITYQKNTISQSGKRFSWPVWLLITFRFLAFSLLAFLLLAPMLRSTLKHTEKPIIVIAADNSQSILLNKDSSNYKQNLSNQINELTINLSKNYDVRTYTFGNEVKDNINLNFEDKQTDLSELYNTLYNKLYNQNIGAVITFTDGIYNQGQNPLLAAERFRAPFYTVAIGDTIAPKDLLIKDVQYNQVVYAGNFFPLKIQVRGRGYNAENFQLSISNKGQKVFSRNLSLKADDDYFEIDANIETRNPGLQRYQIEVSRLDGEISYENNTFDIFVEVLVSRKKILIISNSPHPDVSTLRRSIEKNAAYETNVYLYNDYQRNIGNAANSLRSYQLAILHGLPSGTQDAQNLVNSLRDAGVSIWFVISNQTSLPVLNSMNTGLRIQGSAVRNNDALASANQNFTLFSISDEVVRQFSQWPPLAAPFGEYSVSDPQKVALFQQIGQVKTQMPLLLFSEQGKSKTAVLCGEGIWKWAMFNFSQTGNQNAVEELINKTVQFLSVKTDTRLFRARPTKDVFDENERITFESELYNESYEPVKDAVIKLTISNEEGKPFDYNFQPRGNSYFLDAGFLPSGTYTFVASTQSANKNQSVKGEFLVKKVEVEFTETVANHQLLNQLAQQQGGQMLFLNDIGNLSNLIENHDDIKPVAYMQTDFRPLIDWKWLFGVVLILLAAEWFLRKYFGSY